MPAKKITRTRKKAVVQNESGVQMTNGLSEAIAGFQPSGAGTQLNQTTTLFINMRWYLISNMRQPLSQAYVEQGLIQSIVDVPVEDAMRGGVEIKSKQLSAENIEELQTWLSRDLILEKVVGQEAKWDRLYGGAGIVILTDQDPSTPLEPKTLPKAKLEFRAVDMWELFWSKQNTDEYDRTRQVHEMDYYDYYGIKLHKSRVLILKGIEPPSFIRPRLRGWGLSVVETLINAINQYLKSNNLAFEVLDEFKLDIFKIKGLTQTLLSADGASKVRKRAQLANQQKNYQNSLVMDAEDDYISKQLSFAGLADMYKEFRMQIASVMRMPMSKLFGIPSAGFSSGEDDIENYNSMIESSVRSKLKQHIVKIIELKSMQLFGIYPEDISVDFAPLRYLSLEQEENVKTQKFNRIFAAAQAGRMSNVEFKKACNKANLLEIQVDASVEELDLPELEAEEGDEESNVPAKKAPKSTTQAKTAKNSLGDEE